MVASGANRNDFKLVGETLNRCQLKLPDPEGQSLGICLDKGYDYDEVRDLLDEFGFTVHLRSRGDEAQAIKHEAGYKARRWVIERLHSWMNRFRRILTRWEKRADTYLAMLHFACGIITWRTLRVHEQTGLSE